MVAVRDIYWIAAILDGEGTFAWENTAKVTLAMTDFDLVDRFGQFLDSPVRRARSKTKGNKILWSCRVSGQKAIGLCLTIYSILGERRKEKVRAIVSEWKQKALSIKHPSYQKRSVVWKPQGASN